ncbi:UDP-3-O-acyl-N-acetylglucosamine deacetylase [Micromonospora sp. C95]|uniref:UDP-3-O-acyl-N-acetylglucosamine deacetylase n=1 Tax=Micromonospora sp. C95 TaxID=2824882 RepID=UPI001B399FE6|nr:UDP-3-O-acyl-N-acetylglucosamine deacetylase [Micromonospora sp. C95]MBQ1027541.1 UDP-3-O-acyl-N-acetylglucosamine deacetylase [Micromonospora sp. C95]
MTVRRTVARTVAIEGRGLHSGQPVCARITPGADGIAFTFRGRRVTAHPDNVTGTDRRTRLGEVSTIEHLMAAFAGCGVTDAEVSLSAPELPGRDGSARDFVYALDEVGYQVIHGLEARTLTAPLSLHTGPSTISVRPGTGIWTCTFDLGSRWPGCQTVTVDLAGAFRTEVAPARTVVLGEEVDAAWSRGLGRGLGPGDVLVIGLAGYLGKPRFPDEPARHKLLDLIGDLWLAGVPITGMDVTARRSGHTANVEVARRITDTFR